ncbi:MAG TPA: class I SAM-dependent methyltransferase [Candidatus Binataceae bacterium]|nr:class I SAM-dependent methyltransferase [Candidatus Binataceae bacterium]
MAEDSQLLPPSEAQGRALLSGGASSPEVYRMVATALGGLLQNGGTVLDVGCGSGRLWQFVSDRFSRYQGVDLIRYEGFPSEGELVEADLETLPLPLPSGCADVVAAIETIEHLENPRAFMRELVRLARPSGIVIITTPNQLSLLSKLTLVLKNRFNAFQDIQYPAHLTALLEIDLLRIAREAGLAEPRIVYSGSGRIVFTPWHYPKLLPRLWPRAISDNVCMFGYKAA